MKRKKFFLGISLLCLVSFYLVQDIHNSNFNERKAIEKSLELKEERSDSDKKEIIQTTTPTTALINRKEEIETVAVTKSLMKMKFDIDLVTSSFKESLDNKLNLEAYNRGYDELYRFFNLLGTMFGFIASDIREKIDILEEFRKHGEHYHFTEHMMNFEMDEKTKQGSSYELKGSRTLLRLHRALKFTYLLLNALADMDDNDKVSTVALKAYGESLSNFHPWLIRNAAKIAMYALPTRKNLLSHIADNIDEVQLKEKVHTCTQAIESVYNAMEDLYTEKDLHGLP